MSESSETSDSSEYGLEYLDKTFTTFDDDEYMPSNDGFEKDIWLAEQQ